MRVPGKLVETGKLDIEIPLDLYLTACLASSFQSLPSLTQI